MQCEKSTKEEVMDNALLQLFSRVGIPHKVLTDQEPNFMSHTFRQVYQLLGIKRVRTTPCHPQTVGAVGEHASEVHVQDGERLGTISVFCIS